MEPAGIAKIATEALKPVSGILDALLGPKLKRVKNWAEKRDLSERAGSPVIDGILEEYLRRLLRRICGITTIVFPQQVLPLTSIYEPLQLSNAYAETQSKNDCFDVRGVKPGQSYLIVDSAGMGKSTFAKHFVLEILDSTDKIPVFLELRRIGDGESLLQRLSMEIDESKQSIDDELLLMLFDLGNFILILDGYDELPDQRRAEIGPQITDLAIRCNRNSMILTARPEVSLPDLPESRAFTIKPLNLGQAKSLVLRYDAVVGMDIGSRLIGEFGIVPTQFLQVPLLLALLYRTYGFNQSVATRISSFYDEMYNALYKGHDLSKASFNREKASKLDSEDFRRLLRAFCFLLATQQKVYLKTKTEGTALVIDAMKLTSVQPSTPLSFFEDLLLSVPLLTKDGTEFRFLHKSIQEFFAAEFLAYHPSPLQIIEHISNGPLGTAFSNSFNYMADINPSLFRRSIVAPLAKSVLAQGIQDQEIRTICFLLNAKLGIWPEVAQKNLRPAPGSTAVSCFRGTIGGKGCVIGISYGRGRIIAPSAWEAITELRADSSWRMLNRNEGFDSLAQELPIAKWISVDHEIILKISRDRILRQILINFLVRYLRQFGFAQQLTESYRTLHEGSCKELLEQIEEEDKTQRWLEDLVSMRQQH